MQRGSTLKTTYQFGQPKAFRQWPKAIFLARQFG